MPSNVEIKARVRDMEAMHGAVEAAGARLRGEFVQEDVFFHAPRGRLKLRVTASGAELIHYLREDSSGPTTSRYRLCPIADPERLRETLGAALGVRGIVRKRRTFFLVGQTRIHLDRVEGLGSFLELEVVLEPGQAPEEGRKIANGLMQRLGVGPNDLVAGAYIDLLERRA